MLQEQIRRLSDVGNYALLKDVLRQLQGIKASLPRLGDARYLASAAPIHELAYSIKDEEEHIKKRLDELFKLYPTLEIHRKKQVTLALVIMLDRLKIDCWAVKGAASLLSPGDDLTDAALAGINERGRIAIQQLERYIVAQSLTVANLVAKDNLILQTHHDWLGVHYESISHLLAIAKFNCDFEVMFEIRRGSLPGTMQNARSLLLKTIPINTDLYIYVSLGMAWLSPGTTSADETITRWYLHPNLNKFDSRSGWCFSALTMLAPKEQSSNITRWKLGHLLEPLEVCTGISNKTFPNISQLSGTTTARRPQNAVEEVMYKHEADIIKIPPIYSPEWAKLLYSDYNFLNHPDYSCSAFPIRLMVDLAMAKVVKLEKQGKGLDIKTIVSNLRAGEQLYWQHQVLEHNWLVGQLDAMDFWKEVGVVSGDVTLSKDGISKASKLWKPFSPEELAKLQGRYPEMQIAKGHRHPTILKLLFTTLKLLSTNTATAPTLQNDVNSISANEIWPKLQQAYRQCSKSPTP